MTLPVLRNLDVSPITQNGETYLCLRDPEGFMEEALMLSPLAFFVAAHLDGAHDVVDIQASFARESRGTLLLSSDIMKVVETLDGHGLLQTDSFSALRRRVEEGFANAGTRPAYLAGKSYPDKPEALRAFLDGLFTQEGGPGETPGSRAGDGAPVRCLIVPHIDFHRGGAAYAHGYLRMFRGGAPQTVFIFGVAHSGPPLPFTLTHKHFETPFGTIETDQDIVNELRAACAWDPFEFEIVHRTEHSIEFQTVMLGYLYGPKVRIVPILCGALGAAADNPAVHADVSAFLDVCRRIAAPPEGRVSVIAGADLAHVGRRFGDAFEIDPSVVRAVETRDREDLAHAVCGDAERFYRSVMKDQNQRRVCGLNCIYAALRTSGEAGRQGELLHYGYAPDPAGGIVSFADVLFV